MVLAYLPSPSQGCGTWGRYHPGVRAVHHRRDLRGACGSPGAAGRRAAATADDVTDIAVWAVPFGLVGGRLYHVITDPELYFTAGRQPIRALYIWDGGLGIWGAVALGALGAWLGCRRRGITLADFADAVAPGLVLAQAMGRWGNYFNQELFGRPTTLPWSCSSTRPTGPPTPRTSPSTTRPSCTSRSGTWASWRCSCGSTGGTGCGAGGSSRCYVVAYTAGRAWIEALRVDHANHFLGLRLNDWVSLALFLGAAAYLILSRRPAPADGAATVTPDDPGELNKDEKAPAP